MSRSDKRSAVAITLIALSFVFSVLAVSQINHRIPLVGPEGPTPSNRLFSQPILGNGPNAADPVSGNDDPQGNDRSPFGEPVRLIITVLENISGRVRPVRSAPVNVTLEGAEPELIVDPGAVNVGGQIGNAMQIASVLTDRTGTVTFSVPAGNYTVLTEHFGLVGNFSIALPSTKHEVRVRWTFHNLYERPILVQLNDVNTDGWISPDETIFLFYHSDNPDPPNRVTLIITGQRALPINLTIVSFTVYSHGIYLVVSPVQPIPIGALSQNSGILIGNVWYEVSSNA